MKKLFLFTLLILAFILTGCGTTTTNETSLESKTEMFEVVAKYDDITEYTPDGKYYNGDAHENRAEEILEIIYGESDVDWPGDRLEKLGWIRATTSLMWEVRKDSTYWNNKRISSKQYDALWDWCKFHNKEFPQI